jgi:GTPase SAR1 family protein
MAGSGKTTLLQRVNAHLHENQVPAYILNLDPAVLEVPYEANIDIRDTVSSRSLH